MGLTPPVAGPRALEGQRHHRLAPYRVARAGIGFVPEDRRIFAELTVWENLDVARRAADRAGRWTVERSCELFPKLRELRDRQGGVLSGGEQQMLTIARTLMGNPELLLLDEPSEGLAPLVVENLLEQVQRLKGEGLTILLAEQGVDFSLSLADRVYVLEKGAVRPRAPAAALRDDADAARQAARTLNARSTRRRRHAVREHPDPQGHPQERKDEIARRVTATISEVAKLPKEAVWVVFEDVTADDWYVGGNRASSELQKKAAQAGRRSR